MYCVCNVYGDAKCRIRSCIAFNQTELFRDVPHSYFVSNLLHFEIIHFFCRHHVATSSTSVDSATMRTNRITSIVKLSRNSSAPSAIRGRRCRNNAKTVAYASARWVLFVLNLTSLFYAYLNCISCSTRASFATCSMMRTSSSIIVIAVASAALVVHTISFTAKSATCVCRYSWRLTDIGWVSDGFLKNIGQYHFLIIYLITI